MATIIDSESPPQGCESIEETYKALLAASPHASFTSFVEELEKKYEHTLIATWKLWKEPQVNAALRVLGQVNKLTFST